MEVILKDIHNLIKNYTFLGDETEEVKPVTPCMDVYKTNIHSDGILDKLRLRIVVRGDIQNKDLIGDTLSPADSMRILKYFVEYTVKNKAIVHQLCCIVSFLHTKVENWVFVTLNSRYA